MTDVPPPPPASTPAAGGPPLGRLRNPWMVILLSVVTLGIYTLYWYFRVFQDNKDYSGEGIGGVLGLVFGLFCAVVNFFLLPAEVEKLYRADGRDAPVSAIWGLWFLLPIVGAIIWVLKVQGAINDFWASKGQTAG